MYSEDDLLPLSSLQHLLFCERRAVLVHVEGIWHDNLFTAEGTHLHERVHEAETEVRGDTRIVRGLRLRSMRLGLTGFADAVEFHRIPRGERHRLEEGVKLEGVPGSWRPFPVEYKRGRLRREEGYEIQLCGQALCLEEALDTRIPDGAIYYGKTRRRLAVEFDDDLRARTQKAATRLHDLFRETITPPARYEKKCDKCSLFHLCLPKTVTPGRSARAYLARAIAGIRDSDERD